MSSEKVRPARLERRLKPETLGGEQNLRKRGSIFGNFRLPLVIASPITKNNVLWWSIYPDKARLEPKCDS